MTFYLGGNGSFPPIMPPVIRRTHTVQDLTFKTIHVLPEIDVRSMPDKGEPNRILSCYQSVQENTGDAYSAASISSFSGQNPSLMTSNQISDIIRENEKLKKEVEHLQSGLVSENSFHSLQTTGIEGLTPESFGDLGLQRSTIRLSNYMERENQAPRDILKIPCRKINPKTCILETHVGENTLTFRNSCPSGIDSSILDLDLELLCSPTPPPRKLQLAFLFASPLVTDSTDPQQKLKTVELLDYEKEMNDVVDALTKTNCQVTYRMEVATVENLFTCLHENPLALHFSGHGVINNQANFGKDAANFQGDFLVFEDLQGKAHYFGHTELSETLKKATNCELEFVFVASCHSSLVGKVFNMAGAKHVICIDRNEKIADVAAKKFEQAFYHALFSETLTICESYTSALIRIKNDKTISPGEFKKFKLLKIDTDDEHFCYKISNKLPEGSPNCLSHKADFLGSIPTNVDDFLGREIDMHEIISLLSENRLVTIKGMPGIGKTSLSKAIANYIKQRNIFKNGILYVRARGINSTGAIISKLVLELGGKIQSHPGAANEKGSSPPIQMKQMDKQLQNLQLLIIIDNAEDPLNKDKINFQEFLREILSRHPNIKILLTSRTQVGELADISGKVYGLNPLSRESALELLEKRSPRKIEEEEYIELIRTTAEQETGWGMKESDELEMHMGDHKLMQILAGHPQTISMAAALLQEECRLIDLYHNITKTNVLEGLQDQSLTSEEKKTMNTLMHSLDISLGNLDDRNPQAAEFFLMMGMLPAGAQVQDIKFIWNGDDYMECVAALRGASLLNVKTESNDTNTNTKSQRFQKSSEDLKRYSLLPFMTDYALKMLLEKNKEKYQLYHGRCVEYYADILQRAFQVNGSDQRTHHDDIFNKLFTDEPNIIACLSREKSTLSIEKAILDKQAEEEKEVDREKIGCTSHSQFESITEQEEEEDDILITETEEPSIISSKNLLNSPEFLDIPRVKKSPRNILLKKAYTRENIDLCDYGLGHSISEVITKPRDRNPIPTHNIFCTPKPKQWKFRVKKPEIWGTTTPNNEYQVNTSSLDEMDPSMFELSLERTSSAVVTSAEYQSPPRVFGGLELIEATQSMQSIQSFPSDCEDSDQNPTDIHPILESLHEMGYNRSSDRGQLQYLSDKNYVYPSDKNYMYPCSARSSITRPTPIRPFSKKITTAGGTEPSQSDKAFEIVISNLDENSELKNIEEEEEEASSPFKSSGKGKVIDGKTVIPMCTSPPTGSTPISSSSQAAQAHGRASTTSDSAEEVDRTPSSLGHSRPPSTLSKHSTGSRKKDLLTVAKPPIGVRRKSSGHLNLSLMGGRGAGTGVGIDTKGDIRDNTKDNTRDNNKDNIKDNNKDNTKGDNNKDNNKDNITTNTTTNTKGGEHPHPKSPSRPKTRGPTPSITTISTTAPQVVSTKFTKMTTLGMLHTYYVANLILSNRYKDADRYLRENERSAIRADKLANANLIKLQGVLANIRKKTDPALKCFKESMDIYGKLKCYSGLAASYAGYGYMLLKMVHIYIYIYYT